MRKPLGIGSLGGPTSHPRLPPPRTDPPHPRGHRSIRRYRQDEFGPTLSSPTAIGRNNSHPFKRRGGIKTTKKIHHKSNGKGGPTPALHVPYWVRFGYFARKASVFSMPFSIAGGSAMVFICFLDLVGYAATTCGRLGCGHRAHRSDFAEARPNFLLGFLNASSATSYRNMLLEPSYHAILLPWPCHAMGACIARLAVHVSAPTPLKHREMRNDQSGRSALEAIDLCSSQESDDDCGKPTNITSAASAAAGLKRSSSLEKDDDDDGHDDDKVSAKTSLPKRMRHNADISLAASSSSSLATRLCDETTRQTPDGATVTPGIVGLLRTIPTIMGTNNVRVCGVCTQSDPGRVIREFLPLHYRQGDKWSCGYRNLQMMLSSLLPLLPAGHPYFASGNSGVANANGDTHSRMPPSTVLGIQLLLERAWKEGFDPEGAKHYQGKIRGMSRWIGAVEVASLLTSLSVDCTVVQFVRRDSSRRLLVDFLWQYFDSQSGFDRCHHDANNGDGSTRTSTGNGACTGDLAKIILSNCGHGVAITGTASTSGATAAAAKDGGACMSSSPLVPIYLQYPGHSVTIVGIERIFHDGGANVSFNYLAIDPMKDGTTIRKELWKSKVSDKGDVPGIMRISADWIRTRDIQIIVCGCSPLTPSDRRARIGRNGIENHLVETAGEFK